MDATRNRARAIFLEAVENRPPERWEAYLAGACRRDVELHRRVRALLEAHRGADSLLDHPGPPGPGSAVPAEPGAGPQLGDFRLIREVGRGGMGVVYEAEQLSLGRRVALKVLPFAAALDPRQLQRFQVEAQAAAQLHHTNIVPVYAVGCERGVHYYAMQFIDGPAAWPTSIGELRRLDGRAAPGRPGRTPSRRQVALASGRLEPARLGAGRAARRRLRPTRPGPLPAGPAAGPRRAGLEGRLGRAAGPTSARWPGWACRRPRRWSTRTSTGVIHRDIKPANLLLDGRGNLWITDFGLARLQDDSGPDDDRRPARHAPLHEPRAGDRAGGWSIDHRTDIYSLGATLYELLTLRPAFDGRDRAGAPPADRLGGAAAAAAAQPGGPARPGDDRPQGDGQGSRPAATRRPGAGRRPAVLPRRPPDRRAPSGPGGADDQVDPPPPGAVDGGVRGRRGRGRRRGLRAGGA